MYQATFIGYGLLLVFKWHISYAQQNNQLKIQAHPSTYFEASSSDIFLEHDAIGIKLQLHVPEIIAMGSKTLQAYYDYYLTMFKVSIPSQDLKLDNGYLQHLQNLYEETLKLYPNDLSPVHQATHQAAMVLQQQILEL